MIKPDPDLMDSLLNFSDEEVKKTREKCKNVFVSPSK
jgi:hypothetical protein